MTKQGAATLLWTPRIAGIAMGLFLAVFAFDAFGERQSLFQAMPAFLIHLIPSAAVLGGVALAWRFPLAGAVTLISLALAYAISVQWRLDWIAVIATPLVVIAMLFVASWRYPAVNPD